MIKSTPAKLFATNYFVAAVLLLSFHQPSAFAGNIERAAAYPLALGPTPDSPTGYRDGFYVRR